MSTKHWLVVLLLLGFSSELIADKFAKVFSFGGTMDQWTSAILQTWDGDYTLAGYGPIGAVYNYEVYLLKLNSAGEILWAKTYGDTLNQYLGEYEGIKQTSDGGYILAGSSYNISSYSYSVLVMKLDHTGTIEWTKTFDTPDEDYANSVQQTTDDGYIVVGRTVQFYPHEEDIFILKLSSAGVLQWAKTYDIETDCPYSIQQTTDGGYIIVGYTYMYGANPKSVLVLKLSSVGAVQWAKTFGGISGSGEFVTSVQQTSDGGYILGGSTYSYGIGSDDFDFLVLKLSSPGDIEWAKTYGGTNGDFGYSVQQTSDGGYILGGQSLTYGAGSYDALLIKIDSAGDLTWARYFGGSDWDNVHSVQQTSDDEYILAGQTMSYGAGDWDFLVIKLESDGVYEDCFFDCIPIVNVCPPDTFSPSVVTTEWTTNVGSPSFSFSNIALPVSDVCPPVVVEEENVGSDTSGSIHLDVIPSVGKNNFHVKYWIPKSVHISGELAVSLKLYDAAGRLERVVSEQNIRRCCQRGSYTRSLDLSDLSAGIYFLRLEVGDNETIKKVILLK